MATTVATSSSSSAEPPLLQPSAAPAPLNAASEDATATLAEPPAARKKNKSFIFHISLLYNLVLCHEHVRPWWSRILPHLVLGALPLKEKRHLETLTQQEGVCAVVTMNQPTELLPNWLGTPVTADDWAKANVAQCFGHTGDFRPPSVETIHQCVDFLHEQIQAQRTTYVHCKAGRGRSTVVVLAYLMQHHSMTLDEAHAFVVERRRHISLHPKQRAILSEFAASISSPKS